MKVIDEIVDKLPYTPPTADLLEFVAPQDLLVSLSMEAGIDDWEEDLDEL